MPRGRFGTYAKLVDDRNESAHPSGNIFYSTEAAIDIKITEILRVVAEIQTHSQPARSSSTATVSSCSRTTTPTNANIPMPPTKSAKC